MNSQESMVYNAILNGAIKKGATSSAAKKQADNGLDRYRKNQFRKKVIDLIEDHIREACKLEKEKKSAPK